eukprot:gnl/TRDRNA2_/TRDRNA2_174498_c0_seq4.p1 gnl/TRDRNA2_/TRDRNA2_174498_c0~~gnl/TRDRNA2_/TRDRNA2_174498_c0_seq4.p1  ORF type:complete len:358 (-),score=51.76 gnl/TRDRNA2_/TRDRNA2_174498_c0_seq4:231-1304(-)
MAFSNMSGGHASRLTLPTAPVEQSAAPRTQAIASPQDRQVLFKTKMCSFHLKGHCLRGASCTFAHHEDEMKPQPDFYRTSVCKVLLREGRCDDADCKFAHDWQELRPRCNRRATEPKEDMHRRLLSHEKTPGSNISATNCNVSARSGVGDSRMGNIPSALHALHQHQIFHLVELYKRNAQLREAVAMHLCQNRSNAYHVSEKKCSEQASSDSDDSQSCRSTASPKSDMVSSPNSSTLSSLDHMSQRGSFDHMIQHDSFDGTHQRDLSDRACQCVSLDRTFEGDSSDPIREHKSPDHTCQRVTCNDTLQADLCASPLIQALDLFAAGFRKPHRHESHILFENGMSAVLKYSFLHFEEY